VRARPRLELAELAAVALAPAVASLSKLMVSKVIESTPTPPVSMSLSKHIASSKLVGPSQDKQEPMRACSACGSIMATPEAANAPDEPTTVDVVSDAKRAALDAPNDILNKLISAGATG
jgi:hypothetical protein